MIDLWIFWAITDFAAELSEPEFWLGASYEAIQSPDVVFLTFWVSDERSLRHPPFLKSYELLVTITVSDKWPTATWEGWRRPPVSRTCVHLQPVEFPSLRNIFSFSEKHPCLDVFNDFSYNISFLRRYKFLNLRINIYPWHKNYETC